MCLATVELCVFYAYGFGCAHFLFFEEMINNLIIDYSFSKINLKGEIKNEKIYKFTNVFCNYVEFYNEYEYVCICK